MPLYAVQWSMPSNLTGCWIWSRITLSDNGRKGDTVKDLQKLADECMAQLDRIGIKYGRVNFSVNTRAKKRWGQCIVRGYGVYDISVSSRLLADDTDDMAAKNTIMHELIHAADGCRNGHRGRWLTIAAAVMRAYPEYNIKRTSSNAEKGFDEEYVPARRLEYKYFYRCLGCGAEARYKKASKFTKNPNAYVCIKCRGKFVPADVYLSLEPSQRAELNRKLSAKIR